MKRARRDRIIGFSASFACHVLLLTAGGRMLAQSAEYGIETGGGGIEVHLVAALPARVPGAPAAARQVEALPAEPESGAPAGAVTTPPEPQPVVPAKPAAAAPGPAGDGSAPVPGQDATTFHSGAGGRTDAKPNYLQNPVPPYPLAARRAGAEGIVLLRVAITADGRAEQVELIQSSGTGELDESALRTVRRWKFRPARMGGIAVSSVVEIPIRFVLE